MTKSDKLLLSGAAIGLGLLALTVTLRTMGRLPPYMAHGICWRGDPGLIWSMAIGNAIIFASYTAISFVFLRVLLSANLGRVAPLARGFCAFIVTCGLTHLVEIAMIWYGYFWLQSIVIWMCVFPSAATALYMLYHQGVTIETSKTIFRCYESGPDGMG